MKSYESPPKSIFLAATAPKRPLYLPTPVWRHQYEPISRVSANVDAPPGDVVAVAAMAYLTQFDDRQKLFDELRRLLEHYGMKGKRLKLGVKLDWPDLPRALRSFDASGL